MVSSGILGYLSIYPFRLRKQVKIAQEFSFMSLTMFLANSEELIDMADKVLNQSKENSRNKITV